MTEYDYTVILQPEESWGFSVFVPALPGCFSQGDTHEHALEMAQEAISLYIEGLIEDNVPIPPDITPTQYVETIKIVA